VCRRSGSWWPATPSAAGSPCRCRPPSSVRTCRCPAARCCSGPGIDLGFRDDVELPDEPQPAVSLAQLRSFGAAYLGDTSPDDEVVNALRADLTGQPPMLIQAGTGDLLGKDAHRLAEHARGCGVDVAFELYSAATHDFQVFWSFLPEASDALEQAGAFVRRIHARVARGDGGQRPRLGRSSTGTRSR
jgi:acetyl esterase/lipase